MVPRLYYDEVSYIMQDDLHWTKEECKKYLKPVEHLDFPRDVINHRRLRIACEIYKYKPMTGHPREIGINWEYRGTRYEARDMVTDIKFIGGRKV